MLGYHLRRASVASSPLTYCAASLKLLVREALRLKLVVSSIQFLRGLASRSVLRSKNLSAVGRGNAIRGLVAVVMCEAPCLALV